MNVPARASPYPAFYGTYPPGEGGEGDPQRKLTIPQANATDSACTCAGLGNLHSPLAAGSMHTLNARGTLHNARTAIATDVLVKGDGDVERHSIHEFSGMFVLVLYRGRAQPQRSSYQPASLYFCAIFCASGSLTTSWTDPLPRVHDHTFTSRFSGLTWETHRRMTGRNCTPLLVGTSLVTKEVMVAVRSSM